MQHLVNAAFQQFLIRSGEIMKGGMIKNRVYTKTHLVLAMSAVITLLAACTTTPSKQTPIKVIPAEDLGVKQTTSVIYKAPTVIKNTQPASVVRTPVQISPTSSVAYGNFDAWKSDFLRRSYTGGINASVLNALMANASLNQQVINLDRSQAEFTKMPWQYVDGAVSAGRVKQGKNKLNENMHLLADAEAKYGTPREIITAIWGMESSYGAGVGNSNLVDALSTLAYEGRRREFAENQLISMVNMVERGDASVSQFVGSWAGGMGHTQFIPSTWLEQGVDGDFDGHINPWNKNDALTSTASYLANSGWVRHLEPYYEVRLPYNFNYDLSERKQSLDAWRAAGITLVDGAYFGGDHLATLWLPAGVAGPILLLTQNFDAIRAYNNSSSYALGVSLLARRIAGGSDLVQPWPRQEKPLSSAQVKNLQRNLTAQGYDTQGIDGVLGSNTRRAFARWQKSNGQIPDGFISQRTASHLAW